jgi:hypothetical protein
VENLNPALVEVKTELLETILIIPSSAYQKVTWKQNEFQLKIKQQVEDCLTNI